MITRLATLFGVVSLAAGAWMVPGLPAQAQAAGQGHPIPQALRIEQKETLEQLTILAGHPAPVGPAAKEALALLEKHYAREREFILPPLTLAAAAGRRDGDAGYGLGAADDGAGQGRARANLQ